ADPRGGDAGPALARHRPPEPGLDRRLQPARGAACGGRHGHAAGRRDRHGRLLAGGHAQCLAPGPAGTAAAGRWRPRRHDSPRGTRMRILLLLIPISMVLLGAAVAAFVWAVRRGQFDDLDTPALDILGDDDRPAPRPGD